MLAIPSCLARNVWYAIFGKDEIAPLTLIYDPLSKFTWISSGLCHIAHDGIFYTKIDLSPDDRILVHDPNNISHLSNINDLQKLDCIFICSYQNTNDIKPILFKLNDYMPYI